MIGTLLKRIRRRPAFASCVIALVAIAVLVQATAFSALYALLWKPLPYAHGERLVEMRMDLKDIGLQVGLSHALYEQLRADTTTFSGAVGSFELVQKRRAGQDPAWRVQRITPDFSAVLGAQPALGHAFDDSAGDSTEPPILLSDRIWRTHFAAAADVLGKSHRIGTQTYAVVGVMPRGFSYPDADVDAWVPYVASSAEREQDAAGGFGVFTVAAALTPNATIEQAQSSLANVLANTPLLAQLRSSGARFVGTTRAWRERHASGHADTIGILQLAALLLLAVIGANLVGLVIAQFVARRREFAVHCAIGADGAALRRIVGAELLPLIGAGAVLGLLLTPACLAVLAARGLLPTGLVVAIGIDAMVLAVAATTTLLLGAAAVIAALSTLRQTTLSPQRLRERAPTAAAGRQRAGFMIGQVALCTALAGAAGLLLHSTWRLLHEPRGFDANGVVLSAIDLNPLSETGHDAASIDATFARLISAIQTLPGVRAVGVADSTPFGISHYVARVHGDQGEQEVRSYGVRPGYFKAMGIALVGGRDFVREDGGNFRTIVIDEAFRRARFANTDAVGATLRIADESDGGFVEATVIGVVPVVKHQSLDEANGPPAIYALMPQTPWLFTLVTRTDADPAALTASIRSILGRDAPDAQMTLNAPMQQIVEQTFANRLALIELVGLFALVTLLLAALGLYATLSFEVSRRTDELGVRMALGATATRIWQLVMARGAAVIAVGTAIGVIFGIGLARLLAAQLYQVAGGDAATWALACSVVIATAGIACWLPARRAARIPPLVAMQQLQ